MFTYLDLPFTANLVALLTLSRLSIWLDLQLCCQTGWDLRFSKNSDLSESSSFFFLEGLSEAFIGCTNLFTLHPCFRQRLYIWCNVWSWMTCLSIWTRFSFEFVLSLYFRIIYFSLPMCSLWVCSSGLLCFHPFFGKHLLPQHLLVTS